MHNFALGKGEKEGGNDVTDASDIIECSSDKHFSTIVILIRKSE